MNSAPRFLIAKYHPDVFSDAAKNIGIVLWAQGTIVARFAGEKSGGCEFGELEDADIPAFVASHHAYKEWVRYWRRTIGKDAIRPANGGRAVAKASVDCLDALRQSGPTNYVLSEGGVLANDISPTELQTVVDSLFEHYIEQILGDSSSKVEIISRSQPIEASTLTISRRSGTTAHRIRSSRKIRQSAQNLQYFIAILLPVCILLGAVIWQKEFIFDLVDRTSPTTPNPTNPNPANILEPRPSTAGVIEVSTSGVRAILYESNTNAGKTIVKRLEAKVSNDSLNPNNIDAVVDSVEAFQTWLEKT